MIRRIQRPTRPEPPRRQWSPRTAAAGFSRSSTRSSAQGGTNQGVSSSSSSSTSNSGSLSSNSPTTAGNGEASTIFLASNSQGAAISYTDSVSQDLRRNAKGRETAASPTPRNVGYRSPAVDSAVLDVATQTTSPKKTHRGQSSGTPPSSGRESESSSPPHVPYRYGPIIAYRERNLDFKP